jgi:hypothetical protein
MPAFSVSDADMKACANRLLVSVQVSPKLITQIRDALDTGLVLENERFRQEVKELTGQRKHPVKRGPKPAGA